MPTSDAIHAEVDIVIHAEHITPASPESSTENSASVNDLPEPPKSATNEPSTSHSSPGELQDPSTSYVCAVPLLFKGKRVCK